SAIGRSRERQDEVRAFARRLGLTFSPGFRFDPSGAVNGTFRGRGLRIDQAPATKQARTAAPEENGRTQVDEPLAMPSGAVLSLRPHGVVDRLRALAGRETVDVVIADPAIDRRFAILSHPRHLAERVLREPSLRQRLLTTDLLELTAEHGRLTVR